jgi:monoamine oxidase
MEQRIRSHHPQQSPIIFNQRVTSIKEAQTHVEVVARDTTSGEDTTYEFSHVITTLPLPILRSLDLSSAGLSTKQSNAIRQLSYSASIKVGMQFKTAWWTTAEVQNEQLNIVGGQSFTDRPVRRIVYPSYGSVEDGLTTTLIASYTVAEDADRMGALTIHGENGAKADPVLIDMVLRDLVAVHGVTMEFLQEQLIDTFAWNWGNNPYSMGTFIHFCQYLLFIAHLLMRNRRIRILHPGQLRRPLQKSYHPCCKWTASLRRRSDQHGSCMGRRRSG